MSYSHIVLSFVKHPAHTRLSSRPKTVDLRPSRDQAGGPADSTRCTSWKVPEGLGLPQHLFIVVPFRE